MGDLINGRTPEQIERDLEQCSKVSGCAGCVHLGDRGCVEWNMANALSLIKHLKKRIEKQNALLAVMGITFPEEE